MAVGRISGPLLKANLLRRGLLEAGEENLAFETDLLYIDVVNSRVGIKTATPLSDLPAETVGLDVNGTTRTTYLETDTATLATFNISGDTISSSSSTINLTPAGANPVVYQGTIIVDDMTITGNTIATTGTNTNLEITTSGTGVVNINADAKIYGNLEVTGTITADGDIILGNETTDDIQFGGEVNSHILPSETNTYSLGSSTLRWANVWADTVNSTNVTAGTLNLTSFSTNELVISGNTIRTVNPNTNIDFVTSGTGGVVFGNLKFLNNSITNLVSNAIVEFVETGAGYVKITGTNGVVIPIGATNTRPAIAYREAGMIRFNTEFQLVEVFNGVAWTSIAGTSGGVTFSDASDIGVAAALMLG